MLRGVCGGGVFEGEDALIGFVAIAFRWRFHLSQRSHVSITSPRARRRPFPLSQHQIFLDGAYLVLLCFLVYCIIALLCFLVFPCCSA